MKKLLLPLLICQAFCVQAQISNFKIHVGINNGWIKENQEEPEPAGPAIPMASGAAYYSSNYGVLVEEFDSKYGFNAGISFTVFQHKNFFIETGFSTQYFRYTKSTYVTGLSSNAVMPNPDGRVVAIVGQPFPYLPTTNYNSPNNGTVIISSGGQPVIDGTEYPGIPDPSDDLGKTSNAYLQVPIVIGKTFFNNKLITTVGVSTGFLVYAVEYKSKNFMGDVYKDTNKKDFNPLILNGTLQATYLITKHFGLDLSYQYSFTSIYKESAIGKSNYNILAAGISYHFGSKIPNSNFGGDRD